MHGEVHTIDMPGFLTELCSQLFQAMGEVPGERIKLVIEASPLQMSSDQAVPAVSGGHRGRSATR